MAVGINKSTVGRAREHKKRKEWEKKCGDLNVDDGLILILICVLRGVFGVVSVRYGYSILGRPK